VNVAQDSLRQEIELELFHFTPCCAELWQPKLGRNYVQKSQLGLVGAGDVNRVHQRFLRASREICKNQNVFYLEISYGIQFHFNRSQLDDKNLFAS
jgi:hypothetical protein